MPAEYLHVFLLSASPIVELRGAIPLALGAYELPLVPALLVVLAGNILPAFLVPFWGVLEGTLVRISPRAGAVLTAAFERTRSRHDARFRALKALALVTLVAVPLPFTGAWTASVAAFVFGIPLFRALLLIFLGLVIAGGIVTAITLGVLSI